MSMSLRVPIFDPFRCLILCVLCFLRHFNIDYSPCVLVCYLLRALIHCDSRVSHRYRSNQNLSWPDVSDPSKILASFLPQTVSSRTSPLLSLPHAATLVSSPLLAELGQLTQIFTHYHL